MSAGGFRGLRLSGSRVKGFVCFYGVCLQDHQAVLWGSACPTQGGLLVEA